jgi:hypothetical protein
MHMRRTLASCLLALLAAACLQPATCSHGRRLQAQQALHLPRGFRVPSIFNTCEREAACEALCSSQRPNVHGCQCCNMPVTCHPGWLAAASCSTIAQPRLTPPRMCVCCMPPYSPAPAAQHHPGAVYCDHEGRCEGPPQRPGAVSAALLWMQPLRQPPADRLAATSICSRCASSSSSSSAWAPLSRWQPA